MSTSPSSESSLRILFETALREYEKQAGANLLNNRLTIRLQSCDSVDDISTVIQEHAQAFRKFRSGDGRLDGRVISWLKRTIHVLHTLSTSSALGAGIGLPFPPANAIFAGIGILLAAIKDVSASYDALVDLFESIENFLRRLDIYTKIPPTTAMTEMIVKILVELLSTLALATQQVKQGRLKKFGMKLLGENETEVVLERLDRLNHEESRTVAAQTLEVVYGLMKKMKVVVDGGKTSSEEVLQVLVTMQEIASNINKSQRDQLQEKSRQWLSPTDPSTNYNIARETHQDGTATWFIQGAAFREWEARGSMLWVHGKPGSGKSILWLRDAGLATMAYCYFDFKDTAKRDGRAALSSLLFQLCYQSDPCSEILSRLFSDHRSGAEQPSNDKLVKCLRDMLVLPGNGPTYIILDALDECPRSSGTPSPRESVLELVSWLIKLGYPNLHVCVTSRPEADIKASLQHLASHHVSLHDESGQQEDINNYIVSFIDTDANTRKWKHEEKQLVINRLTQGANGMFRWVFCQLDTLRRCLPGRIRRALDELPGTLDATYERTLLDTDEQNWEYAHRLFQCITVASRPLRVEELAEFLAFDFDEEDDPRFYPGWRPEDPNDAVLSTCSSLIAVVNVGDTTVVQFSHFSVKEFLTSNRIARGRVSRYYIPLEPAHLTITRVCLTVLLSLDGGVNKAMIKNFPLAFYAARYWVRHAKIGSVSLLTRHAIQRVFEPFQPYYSTWDWLEYCDERRESISETPSIPREPPLHRAAQEGLVDLAEWLITSRSQDPNQQNRYCMTPFYYACDLGHLKVAQLLFKHGADVNNIPYNVSMPTLHVASYRGHLEIVRLLVGSGVDINAQNHDRLTPLCLASEKGHLEVVRFLLENGAIPHGSEWGSLPLYQALHHGHQEVAQLLLEHGADINAPNMSGETPLHWASRSNYTQKTARQLLERGANIHARDLVGKTPLQVALTTGQQEIVQLLLQYGAAGS